MSLEDLSDIGVLLKIQMCSFQSKNKRRRNRPVTYPDGCCKFKVLYMHNKSLFVCLVGWGFSSCSRNFIHLETSSLTVKDCKLVYARHLWQLSSEGYLTFHTYCVTGHPFIMDIPEDTRTYCRAFGSGVVTTCVNDLSM